VCLRGGINSQMKIVNIHYTGFGGLAAVVNGLVTAQGAESHEWAMGYYGVAPLDSSHAAFCAERDLQHAIFRPKPQNPWSAWRQLAAWLLDQQPDAIICHSSTAIPPCAWICKRNHIPLIAVEHTPNEVKTKTEWLGSLAAMLQADKVIVLTDAYAHLLAAALGPAYDHRKVRKIANGVSTKQFYPSLSSAPHSHSLSAGMAARLTSTKCHDFLINVCSGLGISLEFAGDGESMASLQALAASKKQSQINFCGLIPEGKMPLWFRGLDIYLHASHGETFSMAILQAMATGLPIIASDISGMNEVLGRDGTCGMLVPNSLSAWRDAVLLLAGNPALRAQMGRASRERAVKFFSTSVMLQSYLSVLDELCK